MVLLLAKPGDHCDDLPRSSPQGHGRFGRYRGIKALKINAGADYLDLLIGKSPLPQIGADCLCIDYNAIGEPKGDALEKSIGAAQRLSHIAPTRHEYRHSCHRCGQGRRQVRIEPVRLDELDSTLSHQRGEAEEAQGSGRVSESREGHDLRLYFPRRVLEVTPRAERDERVP